MLFFVALAVLILSHEFGHFLFAKLAKMKVEEFGFGFPPRLLKKKKGDTVYSLNLIPFGGFVKITGEDTNDKSSGSFSSKPLYWRAFVLAAGVFFNLVLAWLLLSVVLFIGAPAPVDDSAEGGYVAILEVAQSSPAEAAGLRAGDVFRNLSYQSDFVEVKTSADAQNFINSHKGKEITAEFERDGKVFNAKITPLVNPPEGRGPMGIALSKIGKISLPFFESFWEGAKSTVFMIGLIFKGIISLFQGQGILEVSGPIGIVRMVGSAAGFGFAYVIQLIAFLSINLAILNFLPFPALDGGRLLFLGIEAVKCSPLNAKFTVIANTIGFAILILLMLAVTYQDIVRLFV